MGESDEFAEVDVTEAEFDAMMAASEPVEVDLVPKYYVRRWASEGYYTLTRLDQSPAGVASGTGGRAPRRQMTAASAVPSSA
jgi:hypothetical protein